VCWDERGGGGGSEDARRNYTVPSPVPNAEKYSAGYHARENMQPADKRGKTYKQLPSALKYATSCQVRENMQATAKVPLKAIQKRCKPF